MKIILRICLILVFISFSTISRAQVLISLLFGDALNTDKIEFGLIGGLNRSYMLNYNDSRGLNNFNIGFYFHINMLENSYLSTGVLVKSEVGAQGMPVYSTGDMDFDSVFAGGELTTKIHYFYVPIMWQQRFNNRWYLEGGLQLGLRNKAYDYFYQDDIVDGNITYQTDVRDDYKRFDGGFIGGVGYKFKKEIKSIAVGINYYYGVNNVSKIDGTTIRNSSIYFYCKVPIGANKPKPTADSGAADTSGKSKKEKSKKE